MAPPLEAVDLQCENSDVFITTDEKSSMKTAPPCNRDCESLKMELSIVELPFT